MSTSTPDLATWLLNQPTRQLDLSLPELAANLALDEALLAEVEATGGGAVMRLWEAAEPAVILGASGRLHEEVHVAACEADGVPILRRSSGGGTVVIGPGALNVAVVLPIEADPRFEAVDQAQVAVLEHLARAIRAAGPPVEVRGSGDLTLGARKFSGSAQRRFRHHFLVHATLLYAFPLDRVVRYLAEPRRQPAYREGRAHADFVVNLPLPRGELVRALLAAWGPRPDPMPVPRERVELLLSEKFRDPGWIARL